MEENTDIFAKVVAGKIVKHIEEQVSKNKELSLSLRELLEKEKYFTDRNFFSENHTWVRVTSKWNGRIGLTEHAIKHLKDLMKIYADKVGSPIRILEPFGLAETWMCMFDLYSPIAGRIVAVNKQALENVEEIDKESWLIEVHPLSHNALMKELGLLMDEEKYSEYIVKMRKEVDNQRRCEHTSKK